MAMNRVRAEKDLKKLDEEMKILFKADGEHRIKSGIVDPVYKPI